MVESLGASCSRVGMGLGSLLAVLPSTLSRVLVMIPKLPLSPLSAPIALQCPGHRRFRFDQAPLAHSRMSASSSLVRTRQRE